MDTLPLTATAIGRFFHVKGSEVERYYKYHLSDFETWDQKDHAVDWVLQAKNIGPHCSIDETMLCEEIYTILSNKDRHGRKGSVIAIVKGTKAEVVSKIIKMIPEEGIVKWRHQGRVADAITQPTDAVRRQVGGSKRRKGPNCSLLYTPSWERDTPSSAKSEPSSSGKFAERRLRQDCTNGMMRSANALFGK